MHLVCENVSSESWNACKGKSSEADPLDCACGDALDARTLSDSKSGLQIYKYSDFAAFRGWPRDFILSL